MKISHVFDSLLGELRPATRQELMERQQQHWCDPDSYKKYPERLQIRKALANHRNQMPPRWTQLNK